MNARALAKTFWKQLRSSPEPETLVDSLFAWLRQRGLEHQIPLVTRQLELQAIREAEFMTLKIDLSHNSSPAKIKELAKYIGAEEKKALVRVDPSLLGGFKATYRYRVYDGSVKKYLANLQQAIES